MMWSEDIAIEARFQLSTFQMHIYSNNSNNGLVLLKNANTAACLSNYQKEIKYTDSVTIAAYTKTNSIRFLGWFDETNQLVATNVVYEFSMSSHRS